MNLIELTRQLNSLKNWGMEGGSSITKDFEFKDFKENMEFVNKVAELAEKANHHPSIFMDYNKLRLTLTTHSENTITEKDFELAKEIDKISL